MLTGINLLNYLDRYVVSAIVPDLKSAMRLSDTELGGLMSAFMLVYMITAPAFGSWVAEVLSGDNFRQLYVPPGCAHGFYVLSDTAHVEYKCTDLYDRPDEIGLVWDDPEVDVRWPAGTPLLNDRDRAWPRLAELRPRLEAYRGLLAGDGQGGAAGAR